ncbi:MAG: APC family permease [Gammaproteobacteria bacterium]|nr:APC family permease [Gammaproteobacteria bacterium]NNF61809.1 APC family permease [Gammaproteobacteria bacterium]NNM19733.1 APC family permease [Gammaproteobacteria bacterium]
MKNKPVVGQPSTVHRKRSLGQRDLVLFTVSAILLLETLAAAASIGASSIFWWLFLGVVFYIPFALICAEMGCAYPEQGGIYAWIRDAFGGRWGARASWGYWVNTAVWLPAINILFAGIFAQLFMPDLQLPVQIMIGIALLWVAVGLNVVTLDIGKWIPNIGAVLKVAVFVALIIAAFVYTRKNGMANPLSLDTLRPNFGNAAQYIPAIIYGMLGFELVSASSEEMKNPARDVPRAVFVSGLIIITLYTLATAAMLAALPAGEIDLVDGLVDTLRQILGQSTAGQAAVMLLGIFALYTFFSNGVTWTLGCNRAAAEAGQEGELPRFLAHETSRGTPAGAAITMGLVGTAVLVLYGFLAGSKEELFWSLFAFSAVIFLLPYLGMMAAFVKLRVRDPQHPRPFCIPGGLTVAVILAALCFVILAIAIVLFVYTPGEGIQRPVLYGALALLALGEAAIRAAERANRDK